MTSSAPSVTVGLALPRTRPFTRGLYDALTLAFRQKPGNASFAAKFATERGEPCERRLAKRCWEAGWPCGISRTKHPWARPIQEVFEDENAARRLEQKRVEEDAKASAALKQAELAAARMKERGNEPDRNELARVAVQAAQDNAAGLVALCGHLGQAAVPLVRALRNAFESQQADRSRKLPPADVVEVIRKIGWITAQANAALKLSLELARGDLSGDAPAIGGIDDVAALAAFGGDEDEMAAAARELLEGKRTERALRLVDSQLKAS